MLFRMVFAATMFVTGIGTAHAAAFQLAGGSAALPIMHVAAPATSLAAVAARG
ncbi:hypothetical protein JYK14_22985 [Siccirubricoccus sp. KC 17139]|uniref:Uncharacterized protein n=1 Tax=Siccirubricoccus soli TaxID=2899147 RepID=A0ABT1DAM9_9PROT|nr:hypothetical protein [Siccirubricoccus soli]MCO6419000.1 hypothetical protein [Siccirubricoccus soli]MCP2685135.1 hypothetical protein [Siccirubricoccus soli]